MSNLTKYTLKTITILSFIFIVGCNSNSSYKIKNKPFLYSDRLQKKKPTVNVQEYVARVGKKIIIVSKNPNNQYNFKLSNNYNSIDFNKNTIILNKNHIKTLKNEAELAYMLTAAISKANYLKTNNHSQEDKEIIKTMSMAGYDPKVVIDMQKRYLNGANSQDNSWIANLSSYKINNSRIKNNIKTVKKGFSGLQRYKHRFLNIVING